MSIVSGTIAAFKGSSAQNKATEGQQQTASENLAWQKELMAPYIPLGTEGAKGLSGYDAANPLPDYKTTVTDPMASWDYQQSPAYKAKYSLGMEELNKQLQARGLAPSGVGATRAADLSRNLTASDYGSERAYAQGNLTDIYKSRYSQNTDRYNRLLDQVKIGQGAAGSAGSAGNVWAAQTGNAQKQAGDNQASFYSGLGGLTGQTASTGLRAYDYGNKAGWWGQGANNAAVTAAGADAAATAYSPAMEQGAEYLYGL
jgi:hypothetical protein